MKHKNDEILGMVTMKYNEDIQREIKKEWWIKAFFNEEIGIFENARGHRDGYRYNAAAKINTSIIEWLVENERITRDTVHFDMKTESNAELEQWYKNIIKYSKAMEWIRIKLDLVVREITTQATGNRIVTRIVYETKIFDEGYEGGVANICYEKERLREEWRVQKARENKYPNIA